MAGNTQKRSYTVGTTPVQVLPPSQWRVAIIIGAPVGGRCTFGPNADISDGNGIMIAMGDPPIRVSRSEYG